MEYKVKTKDPIVKKVIKELDGRSLEGYKKYKVTLFESNDDFLQHLKEELLDAVNYIETLQTQKRQI
jgi:phospholipid N-methyltransferase